MHFRPPYLYKLGSGVGPMTPVIAFSMHFALETEFLRKSQDAGAFNKNTDKIKKKWRKLYKNKDDENSEYKKYERIYKDDRVSFYEIIIVQGKAKLFKNFSIQERSKRNLR
jgi:hypothetical protein